MESGNKFPLPKTTDKTGD